MKNNKLVLITCVIASVLITIIALFTKSFWGDEILSIKFATATGQDFIKVLTEDYHPPFYFILLKSWIYFFGTGEFALRFFQLLLGICFLFSVSLLFNKLFPGKKFHIVFLLFLLSGELWLFLPMLRYYILASALAVSSTYIFLEWIESKGKKHFYLLMLGYVLMLYTDYPTASIIGLHFIYLLFTKSDLIKKHFVLIATTIITFIPWGIILFSQIGKLISGEQVADFNTSPLVLLLKLGFSFYAFIFSEVVYPFEPLAIAIIIFLAVILFFGLKLSYLKTKKSHIGLLLIIILGGILFTSLLTTFISRHTSFIYTPSRTLFVFPFVYLFIAFIYEGLKTKRWKIVTVSLFLVLNIYSIYNYSSNRHFLMPVYASPWKVILSEVKGEKGVIIADEGFVYRYYSSQLNDDYPEAVNPNSVQDLEKLITEKDVKSIFLLTSGRESTEPTIDTGFITFIQNNYTKISEKKFLSIDESYRKIKSKILKRESYDTKFTLQKFTPKY